MREYYRTRPLQFSNMSHVTQNSQNKKQSEPKIYVLCIHKSHYHYTGDFKKRDSLRIRTWAQARSLARARARAESVADTNSRKSLQVYFYSLYFFKKFNKNKNIKAPQCAVKI
jgi:hypothetical protein